MIEVTCQLGFLFHLKKHNFLILLSTQTLVSREPVVLAQHDKLVFLCLIVTSYSTFSPDRFINQGSLGLPDPTE